MNRGKKLIGQYMRRDENAIEKTKEIYDPYCRHIISNILFNQEDIEECLNDVWLHIWNAIPPNNPSNLKAYVGKISREIAIDRYRFNRAAKRKTEGKSCTIEDIECEISCDDSVWNNIENKYITEAINHFLRENKEEARNIFICRYFYMDSIKEIANQFQVSESKVKMTLHRMRKKLKKYLLKEELLNE